MTITFAVVGHNEAELLSNAVAQAAEAARSEDALWFVDSASTDGSGELAASLGAVVVPAPLGKGAAMAVALERCESTHICFVDADIVDSTSNIPLRLRQALEEEPADMIVAEFEWPEKRFMHAMVGVYRPLVGALFPEAADRFGRIPVSGFRMLRAGLPFGMLPDGFGVETHLNLLSVVRGLSARTVDVGTYRGPDRTNLGFGEELAEVILGVAEADGRLDPRLRPRWNAWVDEVMAVLRSRPPESEPLGGHPERVVAAAARSLPPRM